MTKQKPPILITIWEIWTSSITMQSFSLFSHRRFNLAHRYLLTPWCPLQWTDIWKLFLTIWVWSPKPHPQFHLIIVSVSLCHHEVCYWKLKIEGGRWDVASTSGITVKSYYYQKTRQVEQNLTSEWLKCICTGQRIRYVYWDYFPIPFLFCVLFKVKTQFKIKLVLSSSNIK